METDPTHPATSTQSATLYPIAVLIDELKHDDVAYRLNAIRRLSTIALALGPERSREELIPFLEESTLEDEDEILLALAEELGNLVEFIGGKASVHSLFGPLETLAAAEETLVREKAVDSLVKLARLCSSEHCEHYLVPMVKRLSSGDWFTSRSSACGLIATAYVKSAHNPVIQDDLSRTYVALCRDETPMVRRSAATNLAAFVKLLPKEKVITDFVPVFNSTLVSDDQDSVRLLAVECCIAIAETMNASECKVHLLAALRSLYGDKSWRVRYVVAEKFCRLAKAVGKEIVREDLVTAFVHVLKDPEAEVRVAASSQVPGFAGMIEAVPVVLKEIVPCVKDLVTDSSQHVRSAIALQVSGLAPVLGKDLTIEHLVPLFLQCLKDEFSEVRLNIISKLDFVNQVVGIELLSQSLFPAIVELAEDKQWRVRLAIIEFIPLLAKQLGAKFFDEKLGTMCMSWLNDPIYSIREAAAINLKRLTDVFGSEWFKSVILPKIQSMASHSVFTYRLTTLFALSNLCSSLTPETIRDKILPIVIALAADPIPNIKFNVAKTMEVVIGNLKKHGMTAVVNEQVKPVLLNMTKDSDGDVKYFGQRALATC